MFDLLTIKGFLDESARARIITELRQCNGVAAAVYGGKETTAVDSRVRKVTRIDSTLAMRREIAKRLADRKATVEAHFRLEFGDCEEPQFLHYQVGDFFVAHQDGNTPMIRDKSLSRRISVVIFLSQYAEQPAFGCYGGGELVFHGPSSNPLLRLPVTPEPGTLLAFRAETTHEVNPVTHGERYTIASWYHHLASN